MLSNGTYTHWSSGRETFLPQEKGFGYYSGSHIHPFIMGQTKNKDFFGIFFLGTAASSFEILHFDGYDQTILNYITLGG